MGGVEEVGKVVNSAVATFKAQPLSLALVIMNMALLILVAYNSNQLNSTRAETTTLIVKMMSETSVLLSKCVSAEELGRLLRDSK